MFHDAVAKPSTDPQLDHWLADVAASVRADGFRLPRPRSHNGRFVVDGWTAWERLDGEHRLPDAPWPDAVRTAQRLSVALGSVAGPLPQAPDSPWRRADQISWGEQRADRRGPSVEVLDEVRQLRRPVRSQGQLVHGDLAGNLLWQDGLPPAVIDLTPYWRPAGYAAALVIVDAVLWYGQGVELTQAAADVPELDQLLLRALVFRLTCGDLLSDHQDDAHPAQAGDGWTDREVRRDLANAAPLVTWLADRQGLH